jgi:cytochrome c-type biogenesis protein CcmH/NrfF
MEHKCERELPCGQHITIALWIMGLLVTVLSGVVYGTIDNRNKAVDEHKLMIQIRQGEDNVLRAEANKNYAEIIQRLSRIEAIITK